MPQSYQQTDLLATPKPVAESANMFAKLEEATLRNREGVNQYLNELKVDVGPNPEDQAYVDLYKYNLQDTIKKYSDSGDYAYMGKALQNEVSSFIGDKNITNRKNSWAKVDTTAEDIRQNEKIDALDKSTYIKDYVDNYKYSGDDKTHVYKPYRFDKPMEVRDVNGTLLAGLEALKANKWSKSGDYAIGANGEVLGIPVKDQNGIVTLIPAGTVMEDDGTYKTVSGIFNPITRLDDAKEPFIFTDANSKETIDASRTLGITRGLLENNKSSFQYLIQKYAVEHLPELQDGNNMRVGEIVEAINNGTYKNGILNSKDIKDQITVAATKQVAEAYAMKNNISVSNLDFVPGMFGYDRNPRGSSAKKPPVEPGVITSAGVAFVTNEPSTFRELSTKMQEQNTQVLTDIKALTKGQLDPLKHVYNIPVNGVSTPVSPEQMSKYENTLHNNILTNNKDGIRELAKTLGFAKSIEDNLLLQADGINQQKQQYLFKRAQAVDNVFRASTDPTERAILDFTQGAPSNVNRIQALGLDLNNDFRSVGAGSDGANLEILLGFKGAIESTDTKNKIAEGISNALGTAISIPSNLGLFGMGGKIVSVTNSSKDISKVAASVFSSVYETLSSIGGYPDDQIRGAAQVYSKLLTQPDSPDKQKAWSELDNWYDQVNDKGLFRKGAVTKTEAKVADALNTMGSNSKAANTVSLNYQNLINKDEEPLVKKAIASTFQNYVDDKNISTGNLLYSNGTNINLAELDDKDKRGLNDALQALSNPDNVELLTVIPSPQGLLGVPYLKISLKTNKGKDGDQDKFNNFLIPVDFNTGITSAKLEAYKASPQFRIGAAEQQLISAGMESIDIGNGVRINKGPNGTPTYSTPDGQVVTSRSYAEDEYKRINEEEFKAMPDPNNIRFSGNTPSTDAYTTQAIDYYIKKGWMQPITAYRSASELRAAIQAIQTNYNNIK